MRHLLFCGLVGAVAASALVLACSDPTYVFLGRRYAPERDCLATATSLDVLRGADPGDCPARCVSAPPLPDASPDGNLAAAPRDVYVTVMCPPTPHGIEPIASDDPACVRALAALGRKDTCLGDGGSSAPLPDAGPDVGISDATTD
ncbi:MAG: hypothetical protein U0235_08430 [Polyangiaceae bacterium]